jgi:hypothetical protein
MALALIFVSFADASLIHIAVEQKRKRHEQAG